MAARSPAPRLWLLLLLLLQNTQAAPQTSLIPPHSCDRLENWFYDRTSRSCCYQCPPGANNPMNGKSKNVLEKSRDRYKEKAMAAVACETGYVKKKACPTDPHHCMRCGPEQYLNEAAQKPRCDACVSCAREPDLVEKAPCSFNSSRVCECRPGLFCQTPVLNTCARCQQHTTCKPGFGVKVKGTSMTDVSCEKCPPGTFSDQTSSTDTCKPHTDCAKLNKVALSKGNATHDQVCMDQAPTYLTSGVLSAKLSNKTNGSDVMMLEKTVTIASVILSDTTADNPSSTAEEKALAVTFPTSDAKGKKTRGGDVPWGVVLSVVVLPVSVLLFWKLKVCKRWILILKGKPHLYTVTGHKSGASSPGSDGVNKCTMLLSPDKVSEEEFIDRTLPLELNNLVSSTEKVGSPDLSLTDVTQRNALDCPVDSQVRDHTNNRIENIYIMNADTVIVSTSISEVSSGKNCAVRGCESDIDVQENMEEEELEIHYPEQETESFPGNDVLVPVEEEGKEFHHPTTATEK